MRTRFAIEDREKRTSGHALRWFKGGLNLELLLDSIYYRLLGENIIRQAFFVVKPSNRPVYLYVRAFIRIKKNHFKDMFCLLLAIYFYVI